MNVRSGRLDIAQWILGVGVPNFRWIKPEKYRFWKTSFDGCLDKTFLVLADFLNDGILTKLPYKSVKLKLGFTSIFFKFWHNVCCVASYSVLVGSYTFFDYQSFYRDFILTYHDSLRSRKKY